MSVAGLLLAAGLVSGASLDAAPGLWRTPSDGGSVVRLERCGARLCGAVVSSVRLKTNPDQRDVRNSDPSKRDRALKGLRILEVTPSPDGRLGEGWVYNPEDGRTYRGAIRVLEGGRLQLKGCVVRPICKSQIWVRHGGVL